jgi:hypothetical protein
MNSDGELEQEFWICLFCCATVFLRYLVDVYLSFQCV